ncbi:hypothetical protein ACTD5D_22100 [Nocardia takedensis]|uniref:hypothetical protein n=1 Tax=Nocardia takedensis TaxID=259390 RepID=UPI0002DCBD09|nr:hypothetical protein [Nocardia takedensis]
MGSTGYYVTSSTDTHRFVLDALRENLRDGYRVIAHCRHALGRRRRGGWSYALYAAVADTTTTPVTVSAHVLLYSRHRRGNESEIIVKHLHETEGPADHEGVTRRVLEALTTTDYPEAADWRAAAIRHHRAVADARRRAATAVGAVIRFDRPYTYPRGIGEVRQVLVDTPTRWRRAQITDSGILPEGPPLCAAPGWAMREYEILHPPETPAPAATRP